MGRYTSASAFIVRNGGHATITAGAGTLGQAIVAGEQAGTANIIVSGAGSRLDVVSGASVIANPGSITLGQSVGPSFPYFSTGIGSISAGGAVSTDQMYVGL